MVVGVLLTIDLAIMTTWQVFDPFYRFTKTMEPRVSKYLLDTMDDGLLGGSGLSASAAAAATAHL